MLNFGYNYGLYDYNFCNECKKKSSHIYKIGKLENIWNELQWPFSLRPHYGKRKLQEERPI